MDSTNSLAQKWHPHTSHSTSCGAVDLSRKQSGVGHCCVLMQLDHLQHLQAWRLHCSAAFWRWQTLMPCSTLMDLR